MKLVAGFLNLAVVASDEAAFERHPSSRYATASIRGLQFNARKQFVAPEGAASPAASAIEEMTGGRGRLDCVVDSCYYKKLLIAGRMFAMARTKWAVVIIALLSPYALPFLNYPLPRFCYWIVWIASACWILMFLFFVSALLRRDRKPLAILSAAWVWVLLAFLGPMDEFRYWLSVQGFRIHASPLEDYLPTCRLTEFVEKGVKQTVGQCEASGVVYAPVATVVFYDTTGELALPAPQRTAEWRDAMWHYPPKAVLRDGEGRTELMFGNFYRVYILHEEFDGDSPE